MKSKFDILPYEEVLGYRNLKLNMKVNQIVSYTVNDSGRQNNSLSLLKIIN